MAILEEKEPTMLTEEQWSTLISEYKIGVSSLELSKKYNISHYFIRIRLQQENIQLRDRSEYKQYDINEKFFDDLNNENTSYWFGFFVGDGHNNLNNKSIEIHLHSKDINHLKKFNKALQSNSPIRYKSSTKQESCSSIICNKHISQKLYEYGIDNNKSFTADFPDSYLEEKYWPHFIRGVFDADGSIYFKKRMKDHLDPVFAITGTIKLISRIQQILINKLDLNKTCFDSTSENGTVVTLRYQGIKDVLKIRDYLYKDATIYLQRKYDRFFSFEYQNRGMELLIPNSQQIITMYKEGLSTRVIAKKFNVNKNTLNKFLKQNNISPREKNETKISIIEQNKKDVINLYQNNISSIEIGKYYGVTNAVVLKFLKRWGIQIRSSHYSPLKHKINEIRKLSQQGLSAIKIAKMYNTNKTTILRLLKNDETTTT